MKHSTLFSWANEVCRKGIYNNVSTTVKTFVLAVFMILWGSFVSNAQTLSMSVTGSNQFDLPVGNDVPSNNHHHDGCSDGDNISNNDWNIDNSTPCDFTFDNWSNTTNDINTDCGSSLWTGGYCTSGGANIITATQTVQLPENAAFLDFELFSMLMDTDNDGLDYTQISINGDVVFTWYHTLANNSSNYENHSIDISAYAGMEVEIEITNFASNDGLQGNVFLGCFDLSVQTCVPAITLTCAADVSVECGQEGNLDLTGMPSIEVSACDDNTTLEVSHSDEIIPGNNCSYTIIRTWVATFGNISESCTQTISVSDTQSPEISGVEPVVTVQCLEDVPAPAEASAFDACSGSTPVVNFVSNTGEVISHCDISTAFGPGPDWAVWLPTLFQNGYSASANWHFVGNGSFEQYADGTARIYGTIENSLNSNQQFLVEFWFENAADWTTWSSMGRMYKDDLGCAQPNHYMDWTYYEMVNNFSIMTGLGDFAGDVLYFQHQPTNYFFGMQIGQGANNKNCNYGLSTWFYYNGFVNGEYVTGLGDLNGDASCEPVNEQDCVHNTEFTYLYRAADACGHNTIVSQQVIVNDTTAPEFVDCPEAVTVECSDELPTVATPSAVDNCSGDVTVTYLGETTEVGECLTLVTRTWSADDVCGNRTFCQQVISVVDTTAPTFDATPAEEVTYECSAVEEPAVLTATDNCAEVSVVTYEEEIEAGNCTGNYTIYRHWTAVDNCENYAHFYQTVHVVDTTAPVFDVYPYYTSVLCEDLPAIITAQDNCGSVEVVVSFEELNSGGCLGVLHRIYTATDDCGNSATAEQYITIVDFTAPTIYGVGEETTVECSDVPGGDYLFGMGDVYAIDNCGGDVTLTYGEEVVATDDNCPQSFDVIRTWTAIDYCENVTVVTQLVHVVDTTAPVFVEYVAEVSISCDQEIPAPFATAEDNCGEVTITSNDEIVAGNCPQAYTIVRSYMATDECGNASTLVTYINIYDEEAPIFDENATAQLTVECSDEIPYVEPAATDNCGEVSISYVDNTLESSACYTTIARVFTAVDECGNSSEFTQYINIVDTTAPVFGEYALEINRPCDDFEGTYITATDNCNDFEITFIDEHVSGSCAGRIIRQYAASDICGNVAYATQIITLIDEVAPVATYTPESFTVECGSEYMMPAAQFEDNCDSELEVSEVTSTEFDGCTTIITYTWTAEDHCFNTTSVSASLTIVDTTNPEWEYVPADITIECSDEVPAAEMAYAWDICDENVDVEMTQDTIAGNCANNYTIRRIYRAFDDCGNEAMAIQNINVQDTTAPVMEGTSSLTVECSDEIPYNEPSAIDNCSEVSISYNDVVVEETICGSSILRTFTAVDACGNASIFEQNINIVDTTAPVFNAFETEINLPCDNYEGVYVSATDNCQEVEISYTDEHVSGGCQGRIIRTYVANDGCDNEATAIQIITLTDATAPVVVEEPMDITVQCSDESWSYAEVSFTDNCDDEISVNFSVEYIPNGCLGSYVATWVATDNCGNSTTIDQIVEVIDTINPEFEYVPASYTIECSEEVVLENAYAFDDCSTAEVTEATETIAGDCPNTYTLVRTFTATDNCGNTAVAEQTITVVDTTAPVWNYDNMVYELSFECDETVAPVAPTAWDNCNEVEVLMNETIYYETPCYASGAFIFTAIDACGNESAPFYQYYSVSDNTAPVFNAYDAEITLPCDDYSGIYVSATDNCNSVEISYSDEHVSGGCQGRIIRSYIATDLCGNESYAQQIITLSDETAPVIEAQSEDMTVECGNEYATPWVEFADNCDDELEIISSVSSEGSCPEVITYTWTATDNCNNSTTASVVITIVDTTAPVFTYAPESFEVSCTEEFALEMATASDICDEMVDVTLVEEQIAGNCEGSYTIERTFTATDDCGNSTVHVQVINVVDNIAPEFTFVPEGGIVACADYNGIEMATAVDACSSVEVTYTESSEPFSEGGDVNCGQFLTASVGGWGAPGGTFGAYRDANFDLAFPNGLVVGCGDNTYTFTSAQAIEDFLPAGGPSAVLSGAVVNPTGISNQLASQLVAAELSLGFDAANPNFAPANGYLGDIMFNSGAFNGMTVSEVVAIANQVLGGCSTEYSLGNLAEALAVLNLNYDGAGVDNGNFSCGTEYVCGTLITRNWTAVDACGNTATAVTTVFVYDNVAPVFDATVANVEVSCESEIPAYAELTATDACSEATVERSVEVVSADDCGNQVIVVSYVATDACGNSANYSYTITVNDEVAPVLSAMPADLVLDCEATVPAADAITAFDNCNGEIEVSFIETYVGDQPAEGSIADCNLITPALPAGNPCNYATPWAMALFNMPAASRFYTILEGDFVRYPNGSIHVTASLVNAYNANAGFNVSVWFTGEMDWSQWSTQGFPTSFKADCGGIAANHQDWLYYILQNGEGAELVGWGEYAGSALNLSHAPANNYFGFQYGNGANNYNGADNGFGGWFSYNGTFVNTNSTSIQTVNGAGDFAFEMDCCPDYEIVRCWTAMDCSGNTVEHCQTISFAPIADGNEGNVAEQPSYEAEADKGGHVTVYPNPAVDQTNFVFKAVESGKAMIEIYDLAGAKVASVYTASVEAGNEYKTTFNAGSLATGVYMYKLVNGNSVEMGRLIIKK